MLAGIRCLIKVLADFSLIDPAGFSRLPDQHDKPLHGGVIEDQVLYQSLLRDHADVFDYFA